MKYKEKGITLIALIITVIILLIIAGVAVYEGKDSIEAAKLEELRTNMLLIQAKSREYVEEATFKMGINPEESKKTEVRQAVYEQDAQLEKATSVPSEFGVSDTSTCYWLTQDAQNAWGLEDMELEENERYLIKFDEVNESVEIYNTIGYNGKYSLTDINNM